MPAKQSFHMQNILSASFIVVICFCYFLSVCSMCCTAGTNASRCDTSRLRHAALGSNKGEQAMKPESLFEGRWLRLIAARDVTSIHFGFGLAMSKFAVYHNYHMPRRAQRSKDEDLNQM